MSEWRPIAKPPREYETVIVGRDKGKRCSMPGCWNGERWLGFTLAGTMEFLNPSHWQPLPEAPANGEGQ